MQQQCLQTYIFRYFNNFLYVSSFRYEEENIFKNQNSTKTLKAVLCSLRSLIIGTGFEPEVLGSLSVAL